MEVNSQLILGLGLAVGALFLVACVAVGVFGYTPERAQGIRDAEGDQPVIIEEIRSIRIRRPGDFPHDRLDRHWSYIGLHAATQCYAWCIVTGAVVTSNVASLSSGTRFAMAACFLVGSALVLFGALMGLRVAKWTFFPATADNMTSSVLGDDIRLPYSYGAVGMGVITISMGLYSSTSFQSTTGSLGGWITAFMSVTSLLLLAQFVVRIRAFDRAHDLLIAESIARLKLRAAGHDLG